MNLAENNDDARAEQAWWLHWQVPALVTLVVLVYFTRLTSIPVCGEESRWATAAREMLASGDWVVPRQQGTIFPERPPLGSWAMAAVGALRGQVDLWAVRLPSVLAILATVLAIYAYGTRWLSRHGALAAAAVYATFGQVMQIGRTGESEALFTFFVAGSLLAWHAVYGAGGAPRLAWTVGYALAALGALVKGPQAPVYFVAITTGFLVLERNWRWLLSWGHACGVAVFLLLVGVWLVPFAWTNWTAVDEIWAGLAKDRFTWSGLGRHLATYPLETLGCLLPWSPLLAALAHPRIVRTMWSRYPAMKFLIVALAVTYPTVLVAAGARGRYYMPLYPCVALLIGAVIDFCSTRAVVFSDRMFWRHYQRGTAIAIGVMAVAIALAGVLPWETLQTLEQPVWLLAAWIPTALLAIALLVWASQRESALRVQVAVLTLSGFLAVAFTGVYQNLRVRGANDLTPTVAQLKEQVLQGKLVSLGRVYHRFAYVFDEPIEQVTWPRQAAELPSDVEYFCFDRRPGDTPERRSTSDGRLEGTTPGTLPFAWEEVLVIPCDPAQRATHNRSVVIGRRVREPGEQVAQDNSYTTIARIPEASTRR